MGFPDPAWLARQAFAHLPLFSIEGRSNRKEAI
jgi:hypothetical protein